MITGEPKVGEILRADTPGISDKDGIKRAVFTYQWMAGGADIDGATGASHILTEDEEGLVVQVWVSFTDDAGNPEAVTSVGTAAVSPANTPARGVPAITGILRDGETLTADPSGISDDDRMDNAVFTYRWMAGGVDIDGATGSSYTLTAEEVGTAISVWVSFTDDAGNPEAVASALTEAVAPRPPLTAQFLDTPGSHDGQNAMIFELRFSESPRRGFSYKTLLDHAFTVTGGEVVKARRLEPGPERQVGDPRHSGLQRRGNRRAARHHGLRGRGRHLHGRRPDAVRAGGTDHQRSGLMRSGLIAG